MSTRYLELVLRHKDFHNKYLYYNSFTENHWCWGSKRNSEIFSLGEKRIDNLLLLWPDAVEADILSTDKENAGIIEMGLS